MRLSQLITNDTYVNQIVPGENIEVTPSVGTGNVVISTKFQEQQITHIPNNTPSTSTTTGSLVIDGGLGVGGRVTAAELAGDGHLITNIPIESLVITGNAAAPNSYLRSDGAWVPIPDDTLQSVTTHGSTTDVALHLTNVTDSSSISTGALVIDGGLGVGKKLYANEIHSATTGTFAGNVSAAAFIGSGANLTNISLTGMSGVGAGNATKFLRGDGTWAAISGEVDTLATVTSRGATTSVQLQSTVAQGTAPLTVASTTVCSNLNADLLDGQHGSYYAPITNTTFAGTTTIPSALISTFRLNGWASVPTDGVIYFGSGNEYIFKNGGTYNFVSSTVNAQLNSGGVIWTANNDGTGSGLDADLLDGQHASAFQTKATVSTVAPTAGVGVVGDIWLTY